MGVRLGVALTLPLYFRRGCLQFAMDYGIPIDMICYETNVPGVFNVHTYIHVHMYERMVQCKCYNGLQYMDTDDILETDRDL